MRKILALGLAIAGLFMTAEATAEPTEPPCPDLPAIGTQYICPFLQAGKQIWINGVLFIIRSDGQGCFRVVGHSHNPCQAILEPLCFIAKSDDGELGPVTINLALGSPTTTLTGIPGTNRVFPASLEINLNISATGNALNGTFTSNGPLTLRGSDIVGVPLKNVTVTAVGPVTLTNKEGESIELRSDEVVLNP